MSKEIDVEISFGDGKTPNKNKRIYSKEAIEKAVESLNSKKIFLHKDVEVDRNISSSLGFGTETKQIENKVQVKITVFDDKMTRLFELHNFKFIPTGYGNVSEDGTITDYELIHISPTLHSAFDNLDGRTEDEKGK